MTQRNNQITIHLKWQRSNQYLSQQKIQVRFYTCVTLKTDFNYFDYLPYPELSPNSFLEDVSGWRSIVNIVTKAAKALGVPRAGESCDNDLDGNTLCTKSEALHNGNSSSLLECNQIVDTGGMKVGQCQIKSWIAHLSIALVITIPLIIIISILCCCCFCGKCWCYKFGLKYAIMRKLMW